MDSGVRIWNKGLEVERKRESGKDRGKNFKIDFGGRLENAGVYDKRGVTETQVQRKNYKKSVEF